MELGKEGEGEGRRGDRRGWERKGLKKRGGAFNFFFKLGRSRVIQASIV